MSSGGSTMPTPKYADPDAIDPRPGEVGIVFPPQPFHELDARIGAIGQGNFHAAQELGSDAGLCARGAFPLQLGGEFGVILVSGRRSPLEEQPAWQHTTPGTETAGPSRAGRGSSAMIARRFMFGLSSPRSCRNCRASLPAGGCTPKSTGWKNAWNWRKSCCVHWSKGCLWHWAHSNRTPSRA